MAVAFEYVMETLGQTDSAARRLDPAGTQALGLAKRMRRHALGDGARGAPERLEETAEGHFGLPPGSLSYWQAVAGAATLEGRPGWLRSRPRAVAEPRSAARRIRSQRTARRGAAAPV